MSLWSYYQLKIFEKVTALGKYFAHGIHICYLVLPAQMIPCWSCQTGGWPTYILALMSYCRTFGGFFSFNITHDRHITERMCSDKRRTQHRNVLNWLLLHVITPLEMMYCTAFLHVFFFHQVATRVSTQTELGNSFCEKQWERHLGEDLILYFLFPLKNDVKSNRKFTTVLPVSIINTLDYIQKTNTSIADRKMELSSFSASHGFHNLFSKLNTMFTATLFSSWDFLLVQETALLLVLNCTVLR